MAISFNPSGLLSGSGIDVGTVVSQLINAKSAPLQLMQKEQSDLQAQATALTNIKTDLNGLASAVAVLTNTLGPITAQAVTSSNPDVVTGSAQSSAAAGAHTIVVNNLATNSSYYTNSVAANSTLSAGHFTLKVGTGDPVTFNISGSNVTLTTLANSINQQNLGVTASVINDANGQRLSIVSTSSGAPGDLSITGDTTGLGFTKGTTGTNASLTVDGIPISSTTNTVTNAIPGVTLNLLNAAPGTQVKLSVGADTQQSSTAINNFVSAYNKIIEDINQQFTVDPTTNSEGILGSDSSLRSLQSSLLSDVTYAITGNNGLVNLASLGINMNDDGTLTVDNTQLNNALSTNSAAVQNFFQNASQTGFANNFNKDLLNLTDPTQGIIGLDLTQNSAEQAGLTNQINDFQARLLMQQQQLINQYSTINALLEQYPLLLQAITAQLGGAATSASNTSGNAGATAQVS